MKKKTQPKKQIQEQKKNEKLQEKQLVALDDVELKHVTGGLCAFCTTPWD